MFCRTDVIKHHVHHRYFSEVVDHFNVVTIYRRNIIQTAVSDILANKTQLWSSDNSFLKDDYKDKVESLGNLSLFEVEKYISDYQSHSKGVRQRESFGIVNLVYEDFYLKSSLEDRRLQVSKILERSGLGSLVYPEMEKFLVYNKHNSFETYSLIKNIEEIEKEFSGKENGSLELT